MKKQQIIVALADFILRAASGQGTPEEVQVLPTVIQAITFFWNDWND